MDNKKQIFSIRKCTLGVGSFLIGSFIFFSFAPMQVEAAENTDSSSIQNTNIKNTESSVESNEAPTEKAAEPSVESNEASTEKAAEPSVESNEAPTEKAAEPSVESNEAPTEKAAEPSAESNEAPTEKAAEPSAESNEAPTEKAAEPSAESNEASTEKAAEPSVESNEAPTEKAAEPSAESNEAPTEKAAEPSVESNEAPTEKAAEPSVESNETQTLKEADTSSRGKETLEARGVNKASLDNGVNDKVTYENLEKLSNEIDKNKSKFQATPRLKRSAELENSDISKDEKTSTKILNGRDISNSMEVSNLKVRDKDWSSSSFNQITLDTKIPEGVKENDYFVIKMPKESRPGSSDRDNGIYLGKDQNNIYARGFYDNSVNGYVFEFTDKAPDFVGTNINLNLLMLVNPDGAKDQGKYNLKLGVGDQSYDAGEVNINYSTDASKADVASNEISGDKIGRSHKYTGIYDINGTGKSIKNAQVRIQPYKDASKRENVVSQFKEGVTNFKVYKVTDKATMSASGSPEGVSKEDVTSDVNIKFNSDGTVSIKLGDINTPYIIIADNQTSKPYTVGSSLQSKLTLTGDKFTKKETTSDRVKRKPSESNSSGLVVKDTTPPEVEEIPEQEVEVGKPIKEIEVKGTDNGGKPVKHEVTGLPEGMTFNPETNTISGKPTKPGDYKVTIVSKDSFYNKTQTEFNISVL
ncbi:TPA: fibrinogen-binding adhesin SdrG C-terminal domain-containing protein, partial [Staphylococcus aureus]|nr:fibrinogen-binding adhesin SdrG C-terminal domain-containing protein [Staphylococcus aureus]